MPTSILRIFYSRKFLNFMLACIAKSWNLILLIWSVLSLNLSRQESSEFLLRQKMWTLYLHVSKRFRKGVSRVWKSHYYKTDICHNVPGKCSWQEFLEFSNWNKNFGLLFLNIFARLQNCIIENTSDTKFPEIIWA